MVIQRLVNSIELGFARCFEGDCDGDEITVAALLFTHVLRVIEAGMARNNFFDNCAKLGVVTAHGLDRKINREFQQGVFVIIALFVAPHGFIRTRAAIRPTPTQADRLPL